MQQPCATACAGLGQHPRRLGIGAERGFALGFGQVHRGPCGGVGHDIRRDAFDQRGERIDMVEIRDLANPAICELAIARGRDHLAQRREAASQFVADLAVGAEQQQLHAQVGRRSGATSSRNGAFASFSESSGCASGQSIASRASFQRMPASASRS